MCSVDGRRTWVVLIVSCLLSAASTSDVAAFERLQRKFDLERGLPFSEVYSVKQDTRGFIWIATGGGLFRYDGLELRPWPRESFRTLVSNVATGPAGEVLLRDYVGRLYEVTGEGIRPVDRQDGSPFVTAAPAVWDRHGALWLREADRLSFKPPGSEWRDFPLSQFGSERLYVLDISEDGAPIVVTDQAIWRIEGPQTARRLSSIERAGRALVRADGSIVVLQRSGRVVEIAGGAARELWRGGARPIDMVQRGRTLWVSYDNSLVALKPDEAPELLGPNEMVSSGGPLLVDREGSLWMGTFRGLLQYPVPETVAWTVTDGMASTGPRRLALSDEGIWVDSWGGLTLLRRQGASWRPEPVHGTGTGAICVGAESTMWTGYRGRFLEHRAGRFIDHPRTDLEVVRGCSAGLNGRVWLLTNLGLVAIGEGSGRSAPTVVALPPTARQTEVSSLVLEDSGGGLWVGADEKVCHADARSVASGAAVVWACSKAEGSGAILSLVEMSPGVFWAATLQAGVYRLTSEGRWEQIPGSRSLPTRVIRKVRRSPSGGAWIISYGTILRVVERSGSADGWEIVERPSAWHGLMISDAEDILEERSGDLWITTLAGLVHIPSEVRRAVPAIPSVELVDVLADGVPIPWQSGMALSHRRNRIELRFAGLSYRDPGLMQYQVRLRPEAPWQDASGRPSFQFVDLPPGKYHAEVRASLDGSRWSESTAGLSFTVLPPFWRTWWFTCLIAGAIAAGAYSFYRYRLAQLLRLERMRTRIAADLHDDIGSSLSRIAIQSELIRRPEVLKPRDAERLLSDIGESARSLVDSMSDIVWSIDPKRDDLGSLTSRVRQFALGILEPMQISLAINAPGDAAGIRLAPGQRRHLYLIVKEAIHNIAKHAECRNVSIAFRAEGGRLHLEVKDDGRGFEVEGRASSDSASRGGHGLPSMKARADQLGGGLIVTSSPGEGTALLVTCPVDHAGA